MNQESELQRLERYVEKLLTGFSELRAEKAGLLVQLSERDQQIEELQNSMTAQEVERGEISQRVGKLVEQIEEWESSLEKGETVAADVPAEEPVSVGNTLMDEYEVQEHIAEVNAEPASDEDVRVQHKLFSLSAQR